MEAEILENLKSATIDYDADGAAVYAKQAVKEGIDPVRALDVLTEAIKQVGDGFGRGDLWLPDLIGAAQAMKSAMPIIEEKIAASGIEVKPLGTVVIGTVLGDIHDIGKTMVATFLTANGFKVNDLGVNVTPEMFMEAIRESRPNILAMSALMTTTAPEMIRVIETLSEEGIRETTKIIIGGAGVDEDFAKRIGADGFNATAPGAVGLAMHVLGK